MTYAMAAQVVANVLVELTLSSIQGNQMRIKGSLTRNFQLHADKKENKTFFIYREIQMGSGAKSYLRKCFLIYEEMHKYIFSPYMRRLLVIYDFAPDPSEFPKI